jgi:hypothetical protein
VVKHVALVLAWLTPGGVLALWAAAPPPRDQVAALVGELGSESYQAREEARRKLLALRLPVPHPALLRAAESPDPEARRQARLVLEDIRRRGGIRAMRRGLAAGKRGEVDLFIDGLLTRPDGARDDACWQAVVDFAWGLIDRTKGKGPMFGTFPARSFRLYREAEPTPARADGRLLRNPKKGGPCGLVWAEAAEAPEGMYTSVVVSRGVVRCGGPIKSSIVLANGDVRAKGGADSAVVVCDGDVEIPYVSKSIVIARGNVRVHPRLGIASSVVIAGGTVTKGRWAWGVIKEKERHPLGFVRFFESARVGVTVAATKGGVLVATVDKGKPFARAGVRPGDVVTAIGGQRVSSPEGFRSLLRRGLAEWQRVELKVRRSGRALDLTVRCDP